MTIVQKLTTRAKVIRRISLRNLFLKTTNKNLVIRLERNLTTRAKVIRRIFVD